MRATEAPSRIKVAFIYLKRFLRIRRTSWPFLSGDAFADLADYVYNPPLGRGRRSARLSDAQVIFVRSHELNDFIAKYGNSISPRVIICGNSDFEFHQAPSFIPSSVRLLLLQNSFISDGTFIQTLPIGIENFRFGVNGHPRLFKFLKVSTRKFMVLLGPYSPTHKTRAEVNARFSTSTENIFKQIERLSPRKLRDLANEFWFVACVRGNGIDTHRLWECFYRGQFPLILKDGWSQSLTDYDLPIVLLDDWTKEEIEGAVKKSLTGEYDPSKIAALWMPYWENKIKKVLG